MLSVNQSEAKKALKTGLNIFLTGNAGSGKTYLVKEYAKFAKNIALTATTGIAALNLGGETIHRFLGLGVITRPEQSEIIIRKWLAIKKSPKPWDKNKWALLQKVKTIIIDEASMLRSDQLNLIEIILRELRNPAKPFGGVQMILVGDFFQLPPVVTNYDEQKYPDLLEPFCFQSSAWQSGQFKSIYLNTSYRQTDHRFKSVLDKIRQGILDDEVNDLMSSRVNALIKGNVKPIKLFPHKVNVKSENIACLKKINEKKFVSEAKYTGNKVNVDILQKDCPAEHKLYFCKGAQVMMITNDTKGAWVNGSMGIITDVKPITIELAEGSIVSPELFVWERINYSVSKDVWQPKVAATMAQYPFKLSYASTTHKSQGLTLDAVEIDVKGCFAAGQAYVALSRAKSLEGLSLRNWDRKSVLVDERVRKFYRLGEPNDSANNQS